MSMSILQGRMIRRGRIGVKRTANAASVRIREFLIDTQCYPEIIDRVMADEMKRGL
jgi:hypothetical protein